MGKFDMSKIKGISEVGAGLLNEESKKAVIQRKTEYISYNDLEENPRNKMSMDGIEELASQIELNGLDQPLVVYQTGGKYRILTGHRRYAAIGILIQRGKWEDDKPIECKVKDLDSMDVPLDFEDKEMLSILSTNQTREKTDADIAFEINEWKKIISKLRSKKVNFMVAGYDEEGNPVKKNIAGVNTRDIVAEQMGISQAQVAKFNKVENKGSDLLKEALKGKKINISNAASVASMPKEKQDEFVTRTLQEKPEDGQITSDDITQEQKRQYDQKTRKVAALEDLPRGLITDKVFKRDIRKIQKKLSENEDGIQLTDNQWIDYCRYMNGLKTLFKI